MKNKIGVITSLRNDKPCFTELKKYGLNVCQLVSWNSSIWNDQLAEKVTEEAKREGVQITAFWAGYCPPNPGILQPAPSCLAWCRRPTVNAACRNLSAPGPLPIKSACRR